jgi:hypothetical protein
MIGYAVNPETSPPLPASPLTPTRVALRSALAPFAVNTRTINTSTKTPCNPRRINTSKIAGLKVPQNQHLQKNRGHGGRGCGGCGLYFQPTVRSYRPCALPSGPSLAPGGQPRRPAGRAFASILMPEQIIKRRSRGFICVNAHLEGCRINVERQIAAVSDVKNSGESAVLLFGGAPLLLRAVPSGQTKTPPVWRERTAPGAREAVTDRVTQCPSGRPGEPPAGI